MNYKPWTTANSAAGTPVLVETTGGTVIFGTLESADVMLNLKMKECTVINSQGEERDERAVQVCGRQVVDIRFSTEALL